MKSFILLSFVLLGWAFYVMSGGADFDAQDIRTARLAAIEAKKPKVEEPKPVVVAEAPKVVVDTDPTATSEVTRVSLNLTTLQEVLDPAVEEAIEAAETSAANEEPVPQNVGITLSSVDTPAIIPSLIAPNDGVEGTTQIALSDLQDLRTVSGNRVNVRGGPGTRFDVVGRLVRGDEVVVLEDNGNGWVRFETVDGATGGWIADFLLTGG